MISISNGEKFKNSIQEVVKNFTLTILSILNKSDKVEG
jgi:hypothetical protein